MRRKGAEIFVETVATLALGGKLLGANQDMTCMNLLGRLTNLLGEIAGHEFTRKCWLRNQAHVIVMVHMREIEDLL